MKRDKASAEFILSKEVALENVAPGMNRQIMGYDDKILLAKVDFEKGGIGSLHNHHHSQVTYVVNGSFEVTIGDEKKVLNGGDSFYIPPMVMHGAICLEAGTLIDVFSPVREDFFTEAEGGSDD